MWDDVARDLFDDVRRDWIHAHAGMFISQKRRAQILGRRIRERHRKLAGARPNPHDDNILDPLFARRPVNIAGHIEVIIVAVAAVVTPIGWLAGVALYRQILKSIPQPLRSYPVLAVLWTGVVIGTITVAFYDPGTGLTTALVAPWLLAQIPAMFLAAGVYGVINGWLAVDGATEWLPLAPQPVPADRDFPMGPDDMTGPGVFHQHDVDGGEDATPIAPLAARRRAPRRSAPLIVTALVVSAIGIVWTIATVTLGLVDVATHTIDVTMVGIEGGY